MDIEGLLGFSFVEDLELVLVLASIALTIVAYRFGNKLRYEASLSSSARMIFYGALIFSAGMFFDFLDRFNENYKIVQFVLIIFAYVLLIKGFNDAFQDKHWKVYERYIKCIK